MKTLTVMSLMALMALKTSSAFAQDEYVEPGPDLAESFDFNFERTHDKGVYLRASAGLGFASSTVSPPAPGGETGDQSGMSLTYGAHLGGFVAPRVSLHLSQWGQIGAERGFLSAGPGLTFYFLEDANFFFSVAAGATTLYDAAPDLDAFTQLGLGTEAELGTGWWVSPESSLGLSLVGGATAFDLDGDQVAGSGWYAGLRMTYAFN